MILLLFLAPTVGRLAAWEVRELLSQPRSHPSEAIYKPVELGQISSPLGALFSIPAHVTDLLGRLNCGYPTQFLPCGRSSLKYLGKLGLLSASLRRRTLLLSSPQANFTLRRRQDILLPELALSIGTISYLLN